MPTRFQEQIDYMRLHPECLILGTGMYLIDDAGRRLVKKLSPIDHLAIDEANIRGAGANAGANVCHPTWVMRRDAIIRLGGYREAFRHAEDLDLLLRAAEAGALHNLDRVLLLYRQHASSIGYSKRAEQVLATQLAIMEACQRRGMPQPRFAAAGELSSQVVPSTSTHFKWAWWALQGGNKATARHHAWRAFISQPFSFASVKLLACAIRGH